MFIDAVPRRHRSDQKFRSLMRRPLVIIALTALAWSAEPAPDPGPITAVVRSAVDKGAGWLLARQHPDGSWSHADGAGGSPGLTAIATLALLGIDGKHPELADAIAKSVAHLRGQPGMIGRHMYDHAFATICLAEAAMLTGDGSLRADIKRAVQVIVRAQNKDGGWRYPPVPSDADLSMTATQVVAMRAALLAGVQVPRSTLARAVGYIRTCCSLSGDGGFGYMPAGPSGFARTGAACFTLLAVVGDDRMVQEGLAYLLRYRPLGPAEMQEPFWWYGQYYAAAALHMAQVTGPVQRQVWADWYAALSQDVIARQQADGHWNDVQSTEDRAAAPERSGKGIGGDGSIDPLATALACIILSMPGNRLPVFLPERDASLLRGLRVDTPRFDREDEAPAQAEPTAGGF